MCENPLRALPKMDVLLSHPTLVSARETIPYGLIRQAARDIEALNARFGYSREIEEKAQAIQELSGRLSEE